MSKFCEKCGAQLEDGVLFCDKCGAKQEAPAQASAPVEPVAPVAPAETAAPVQAAPADANQAPADLTQKQPIPSSVIGIVAAAAGALVVLIILIALFSGGAKSAVKDYMKAFEKGNAKKMLNLTIPKKCQEGYLDELYDMEVDEYVESQQAIYDAMWKGLKEEGKVKVDYEIKDVESLKKLKKLKKDVKEDYGIKDLDDLKDELDDADYLDDGDFDADKIKKAYAVEIKGTVTVDKEKLCKFNDVVIVMKYKGDWVLLSAPVTYNTVYYEITKDAELEYNEKKEKYEYKVKDYQDAYDDMTEAIEDFTKESSKDSKKDED